MIIQTEEQLREIYAQPKGRSVAKQLPALEKHSRRFIELSPFMVLASHGSDGSVDASPRGGEPGFVTVLNDNRLIVPDSKGNNRLDGLTNIIATGKIGLIFMIPGVDETLRVNGNAVLSNDPDLLELFRSQKNPARTVIDVEPLEVYLHCAKALMRSKLWSIEAQIRRDELPTMAKMINDQTGSDDAGESQESMVKRYQADL
ncbi:MAG: pyridoxamine 5'-phosphate oxidase family protein [Gammaproteobacteria bacterium]|nr:pyridoxamine 5'-phosphate oxidase family protein [Gammaproteobacteria bacterium]